MTDKGSHIGQDDAGVDEAVSKSDHEQIMEKLKESITVEKKEIGSLRIKMTVTVPRETIEERMGEQFAELKRDATVPGFRKGHAPIQLVEKRFATDVGSQLKRELVSSGYLAAVEKEDINALGDPLFWVPVTEEQEGEDQQTKSVETEKLLPIDQALDSLEFPKEGALTFACEIELKPEFELPNLEKIAIKRVKLEVADSDVDAELTRMRMMRGTFNPVDNGQVELDDMMYVDFKMIVDGNVVDSEENFDVAARDMNIRGVQLEGFGEAVKGKKLGEKVTVEGVVPDDHDQIDIREKKVKFELTINEIKRLVVPPFDKAFLESAGFDSEEELKDLVRNRMDSELKGRSRGLMHEQVGDYLLDSTDFELPAGLSQRQVERSISRRRIQLLQAGMPEAEIDKSMDDMRVKARDQVIRDLKLFFILEKIAEDRDITVPEDRINGAIAQIAVRSNKRFDRVRDELSKGDGLTMLYLKIRDEMILDLLIDDADISDAADEKESPKKKAATKAKAKTKVKTSAKEKPAVKTEAKKTTTTTVKKKTSAKKAPAKKVVKKKKKSS